MWTLKELRKLRAELYLEGVKMIDIASELPGNGPNGKMTPENVSNVLKGVHNNETVILKAIELLQEKKAKNAGISKTLAKALK